MYTVIIAVTDKPDRNNRIYPKEVLEKAIADIQPRIKDGSFVGTLNGQYGPDTCYLDISHLIKDVRIEGDKVIADLEILSIGKGPKLKELLEHNRVDFLPRGLVKMEGNTIAECQLLSVDAYPVSFASEFAGSSIAIQKL